MKCLALLPSSLPFFSSCHNLRLQMSIERAHLCTVQTDEPDHSDFILIGGPGTASVDPVVRHHYHQVILWLWASHLGFVHVSPSVKQVNTSLCLAAVGALLESAQHLRLHEHQKVQ